MRKDIIVVAVVIALALAGLGLFLMQGSPEIGVVGGVHAHADFRVFLNGIPFDFSQEKYMSTGERTLSNFTHLHDMDGNVMHKHATGVNLGFFFETLGMEFTQSCFITDDSTEYCNEGDKVLKFYVNGIRNSSFDRYEIKDLDRILISYGNETEAEIRGQIDALSENACIYSEKCPEKGLPPPEASCVGTGCTPEGI